MIQGLKDLDFGTWAEIIPIAVTILMMTFSYSIAEGIVWGIISYTAIKAGIGKFKDISVVMIFLSVVFLLKGISLKEIFCKKNLSKSPDFRSNKG